MPHRQEDEEKNEVISLYDSAFEKAAAAFTAFAEEMRSTHYPYWLHMQGHHGKSNRTHRPGKPFRKSAAARKVYKRDVWWL